MVVIVLGQVSGWLMGQPRAAACSEAPFQLEDRVLSMAGWVGFCSWLLLDTQLVNWECGPEFQRNLEGW